jgi:serine/threonine protein kinase
MEKLCENKKICKKRFTLHKKVGKGAFADVWSAYDKKKNREVVIKFHKKGGVYDEHCEQEITLLEKIHHDLSDKSNIINYYGYFPYEGHTCLLFEKMDTSLENILYERKMFSEDECKLVIRQILNGLLVLRRKKIIHTDLKPDNILCSSDLSKVVICDFGNSCYDYKHFSDSAMSTEMRAPEIILGNSYDDKIDIWSVGLILFELLTGLTPFYLSSNPEKYKKEESEEYERKYNIESESESESESGSELEYESGEDESEYSEDSDSDSEDDFINFLHLYKMISMLGNIPLEYYKDAMDYDYYFNNKGQLLYYHPKFIVYRDLNTVLQEDYNLTVSEKCLDFLKKIIHWIPESRMSIQEALEHPFLN